MKHLPNYIVSGVAGSVIWTVCPCVGDKKCAITISYNSDNEYKAVL